MNSGITLLLLCLGGVVGWGGLIFVNRKSR